MRNFINQWVEYLKNEEKSKCTIEAYKHDTEQFLTFINKDITEANKVDIQEYKSYLSDNKLSIGSINRKLISIKAFVKYLAEELEILINVPIKLEKVQKQLYLNDTLTKEDFYKLVEVAEKENDYRAKAIFWSLFLTGMRVSELLQLTVNNVENDALFIKGKGSKHREILMPEKLNEVLREYLQYRNNRNTDLLFTSDTGKEGYITRTTVNSIIKKYAKKARVKLTKAHAHSFRHLFCLSLLENGVSIDTVADLAGHSDINTTRIYTRQSKDQLKNVLNGL